MASYIPGSIECCLISTAREALPWMENAGALSAKHIANSADANQKPHEQKILIAISTLVTNEKIISQPT